MIFRVKPITLPHDGIIPGARGHKKITIPAGTKVFCIVYHNTQVYWAAYLEEAAALQVAKNLEACTKPEARRTIDLPALLAWNFKSTIPTRIVRPERKKP